MDNTQKPSSPPTFDPLSPLPPPPLPTTPPWPPTPEPAPPPPVSPLGGLPPFFTPTPPMPTFSPEPPLPPPPAPPPPPTPSPLDNPWGAPAQPPPINTPSTPPPWTPPASPIEISESPPTDLSHLVGNNPQPEPASTNLNQAETLVVPSTIVPETSTEHLENDKKGMPKWLIGVGVGLLIAILGASAYFIMGIGQTPKTTSLPAVDTSQTTQIKPPAPLPTPVSEKETSSFGELQGGGQQATSAGDLLRQGQQQGR